VIFFRKRHNLQILIQPRIVYTSGHPVAAAAAAAAVYAAAEVY